MVKVGVDYERNFFDTLINREGEGWIYIMYGKWVE